MKATFFLFTDSTFSQIVNLNCELVMIVIEA